MAAGRRLPLGLAVGLGLLAGLVTVGQAWLLSQGVSRAFLHGADLTDVAPALLGFLLLALLRAGLVWGSEAAAQRLAEGVKHDLRGRLAAHLLALGPAFGRGQRSGELVNTIVEGIEALDAYFRQYLPQVALAALVPLAVLALVFPRDWISRLVLLLTAPLIPIFMILIGSAAEALTRRQWASLSRMSAHFLDVLQGLATLKHLGRSREQAEAIARVGDHFRQATMGVLRVAFLSALVLEMVATISTAVVAVQVGLRLLYGRMAFQPAFFVLLLAPEFYLPLRLLGSRFHASVEALGAAERIWQILETPPATVAGRQLGRGTARPLSTDHSPSLLENPDTQPQGTDCGPRGAAEGGGSVPSPSSSAIVFEDVYYAYEGHDDQGDPRDDLRPPALRGVSFRIEPGETAALVGASGAGKTTVAYLLLAFSAPDRGSVWVGTPPGGRRLHEVPPEAWRQQVAWVPQEPYLFHGSVAHNLRLARPEATMDEVVWAARQAHAHEFVAALPQGYDTPVGERGARLSGGQVQRLALARAFLKDAPLLVLDEATANLDPEIEALVQEALGRLLRGRTALLIAHRLATVYRADRILVLDGGRLVQEGTHAGLLAREGVYRRLVGAYTAGGMP
jgi:ATP-binding cassette subfamily C protein CydD